MRFEQISTCPGAALPVRATKGSAGYDFECAEDVTVPAHSIKLIPTGIKCQIDEGYYLQLALRSSTPKKKGLMLANGIGIIDSDYYNNPDNEGHIMFQVYNFTDSDVLIPCGERIGQGVFIQYGKTDHDVATGLREGGFGSTSGLSNAQHEQMNQGFAIGLDRAFGFKDGKGPFASMFDSSFPPGGDCLND